VSLQDRDLTEKNEDRIDSLFTLFEALKDGSDQSEHNAERIDVLENQLDVIQDQLAECLAEIHDDSKRAKIARIVEAAENKADAKTTEVAMDYQEIMMATGVGSSQAYNYINDLPADYTFLHDAADKGSVRGDRRLVVDIEAVGKDSGPFHRWWNESRGTGGSA